MQVINSPSSPQFIQLFEVIARPTERLDTHAKEYGSDFNNLANF